MSPNAPGLIVIIFTIFASSRQGVAPGRSRCIVDAKKTTIREFPYFAALDGCGAAILSEKWLITAAHCVHPPTVNPGKYVWVGGERFCNSQKVTYKKAIIHPQYNIKVVIPFNDIALLELNKNLTFSDKVKPIEIGDHINGNDLLFVGKGNDETGRQSRSLKKLKLKLLKTQQCLKQIPSMFQKLVQQNFKQLETNNICARRTEDKPGISKGDSGSPLTNNNKLVGLTSYIAHTNSNNRLKFFTNVLSYAPWIKSVTGLN